MLSLQVKPSRHSLSEAHVAPSPPFEGGSSPQAVTRNSGITKSARAEHEWATFMPDRNDTYRDPEQDGIRLKPCGPRLGFV